MSKYQNIKTWSVFILLLLGFINLNAVDINTTNVDSKDLNLTKVEDKVYVIFGKDSSARVESGRVIRVGKSNSKVIWDSCSDCEKWISNSSFYYTLNKANQVTEQMELDDLSMSDCGKKTILDMGILPLYYSIVNPKE